MIEIVGTVPTDLKGSERIDRLLQKLNSAVLLVEGTFASTIKANAIVREYAEELARIIKDPKVLQYVKEGLFGAYAFAERACLAYAREKGLKDIFLDTPETRNQITNEIERRLEHDLLTLKEKQTFAGATAKPDDLVLRLIDYQLGVEEHYVKCKVDAEQGFEHEFRIEFDLLSDVVAKQAELYEARVRGLPPGKSVVVIVNVMHLFDAGLYGKIKDLAPERKIILGYDV